MKEKLKYHTTTQIIMSFFSAWALMKTASMESGNVFTLIFMVMCFLLFRFVGRRVGALRTSFPEGSHVERHSLIISVIFSILYMANDYEQYVETLTNRGFRLIVLVTVFLGYIALFFHLVLLLFTFSTVKKTSNATVLKEEKEVRPLAVTLNTNRFGHFLLKAGEIYSSRVFLFSFLLCIIGWLPYFLYHFPGIMTPDSINQFEQVLGIKPFSNHHPFLHTLVIKALYSLGMTLTNDRTIAMSFYTFFQVLSMALSVGYFIKTMELFKVRRLFCFITACFFAFVPYNGVYAVTVWKDIPFACALLVFLCSLLQSTQKRSLCSFLLFVISGFMLCLFRSNGWYAFLLCLPFFIFYLREKIRFLLPALGIILLLAIGVKYPLMKGLNVTAPDLVESLSIPIQQISAVICNEEELTLKQSELIDHVIDTTYIKELYVPYYADNMKELVRAGHPEYLKAHKGQYLKLYLQLGLTHPGTYLKAYIQQTNGYWYPDFYYNVAEAEGIYDTSFGVEPTPLIRGPIVVKWKEISLKLAGMVPIYGMLWSNGVTLWIMILCMGTILVRKETRKLIFFAPGLALLLTVLIATPVATEFRYAFFNTLALPFYIFIALIPIEE